MTTVNTKITVDNTDAARAIADTEADLRRFAGTATKAGNDVSRGFGTRVQEELSKTRKAFRDTRIVLGELFAGFGAVKILSQIFEINNSIISARNGLMAFTGSMKQSDDELEQVGRLSQKLGLSFATLAEQWNKLRGAAGQTTLSTRELWTVFTQVSETARVLNLDAMRTEGAFRALTQMLSKAKVQAEELRGQLSEHIPGAFAIAAKAMGITTRELDKMVSTGRVFADDFIPKLAKGLEETFGASLPGAIKTSQSELTRLQNDFTLFIKDNNDAFDKSFLAVFTAGRIFIRIWDIVLHAYTLGLSTILGLFTTFGSIVAEMWIALGESAANGFVDTFVNSLSRGFADLAGKADSAGMKEIAQMFTNFADATKVDIPFEEGSFSKWLKESKEKIDTWTGSVEISAGNLKDAFNKLTPVLKSIDESVFNTTHTIEPLKLTPAQDKLIEQIKTYAGGLEKVISEYNKLKGRVENELTQFPEIQANVLDILRTKYINDIHNFVQAQLKKKEAFYKMMGDMEAALRASLAIQEGDIDQAVRDNFISPEAAKVAKERLANIFEIDKFLNVNKLSAGFNDVSKAIEDFASRSKDALEQGLTGQGLDRFNELNKKKYLEDLQNFQSATASKLQTFYESAGQMSNAVRTGLYQDILDIQSLLRDGIITEDQANVATERLSRIATIDASNFFRGMRAELSYLGEDLDGIGVKMQEVFGGMAGKAINDVADAIGQAVAYGQDFKTAINEIGRSIVADIISALVKMGIQMALNAILGKTLTASATATTIAAATAASAAWATPAFLASVATLGTADATGAAALAAGISANLAIIAGVQAAATAVGTAATGRKFGGFVSRGNPYQVGEDGTPEMFKTSGGKQYFIPPDQGIIAPLRRMDNSSGGGSANVVVNIIGSSEQPSVNRRDTPSGVELDIIFNQIDKRIANGLMSGSSETSTAMERTFGIQRNRGRL